MTIGRTAYVLGGYDGPSLDPEVLATSNGASFRDVTVLPVPVRYPAVATLGGLIYLFGGQSVDGRPVGTVQVVDPSAGTAQVIGRLPLAAVRGGGRSAPRHHLHCRRDDRGERRSLLVR